MEYKGYTATVEFDESINAFHGRVDDIVDVVTFEATTVDDLRREFEASVDDYLEMCSESGDEPQRPYSGKFVVRVDPQLHRAATVTARRAGESLNSWIESTITRAVKEQSTYSGVLKARTGST